MRLARRLSVLAAGTLTLFVLAVALTARPGDPALFPPSGTAETIALVSHGWHSGLIVPRVALLRDGTGSALRTIAERFRAYDQLEFGWGEARFYQATPTVRDVDWRLAVEALFTPGGAEGVVQVVGLPEDVRAAFPHSGIVSVPLSQQGLVRLVARLDAAFASRDGRPVEIGPGLYGPSLFYAGTGRFSWTNVCNHWTAGLLNAAGVPVAPILATLPRGLILDLEWRSGLHPMPASVED